MRSVLLASIMVCSGLICQMLAWPTVVSSVQHLPNRDLVLVQYRPVWYASRWEVHSDRKYGITPISLTRHPSPTRFDRNTDTSTRGEGEEFADRVLMRCEDHVGDTWHWIGVTRSIAQYIPPDSTGEEASVYLGESHSHISFGWPVRIFEGVWCWSEGAQTAFVNTSITVSRSISLDPHQATSERPLYVNVRWIALFVGGIFAGLVVLMLERAWTASVALSRRFRCRCESCGYPIRSAGSLACSECGAKQSP